MHQPIYKCNALIEHLYDKDWCMGCGGSLLHDDEYVWSVVVMKVMQLDYCTGCHKLCFQFDEAIAFRIMASAASNLLPTPAVLLPTASVLLPTAAVTYSNDWRVWVDFVLVLVLSECFHSELCNKLSQNLKNLKLCCICNTLSIYIYSLKNARASLTQSSSPWKV